MNFTQLERDIAKRCITAGWRYAVAPLALGCVALLAGRTTLGWSVLILAPVLATVVAVLQWFVLSKQLDEPAVVQLPRRSTVFAGPWRGPLLVLVGLAGTLLFADMQGRAQAQEDREAWRRGCSVPQEKPCVDVIQNGAVVGTGFVIAESSEAIAFFDPAADDVRTLRKGTAAIIVRPHRQAP